MIVSVAMVAMVAMAEEMAGQGGAQALELDLKLSKTL